MLSRDGTAWAPTRPANQASSGNTNSILGKRESALGKAESIFIEQSSPRVVSARGDTRPGRTMFRRFSSESLFVEATLRRHPSRCFCGGRTSVRFTLLLAAVPPHRLHVALPDPRPVMAKDAFPAFRAHQQFPAPSLRFLASFSTLSASAPCAPASRQSQCSFCPCGKQAPFLKTLLTRSW